MQKDEGNVIKLNICYGCMRKLEEGQKVCPFCGHDNSVSQNRADMLPEGTVLSRKYLIGRVLGRGGFGVTYLGYDLDLQLKVAIKEYFPIGVCARSSQSYNVITSSAMEDHAVFSKGCEAFLDEARTLAKFKSPYIVHVRDFFREHGTAYIVMDFEEGVTMKAEMNRNGGKLPYERVLSLMEPLIRELGALHSENIIHRDIKPDNIMLVKDRNGEHLILLDFGTARTYVSNETKTMTGVVTSGYSPKEQYSQKSRQGPYTDVYALCATMYHAITGILPPASIERALEGVPLKSFEECGVSVPQTVEQAIMHGMALKSTERTQTTGQLLKELNDENTIDRGEKKTVEEKKKLTSEVKTFEPASKSNPEKPKETSAAQAEAVAPGKGETKPSAVPKILAAISAGVLLFAGIYFGILKNTGAPYTKPEATKEAAEVSQMSGLTADADEKTVAAYKTVGNIVTFGAYEQDNRAVNGKEDIKWIVLANEGSKSLLISLNSLDVQPYNTDDEAVTWENCTLRSWLNDTFLNEAFSPEEQKAILTTNVDNSENQGDSRLGVTGNNTEDKVYLLSYAEAKDYFDSDSERTCKPTSYAKTRTNLVYTDANGNRSWWLRSPSSLTSATFVNYDGSLISVGKVNFKVPAVRPALWIDLDAVRALP